MTLMSREIRVIMACDKLQLGPFDYVVRHMSVAPDKSSLPLRTGFKPMPDSPLVFTTMYARERYHWATGKSSIQTMILKINESVSDHLDHTLGLERID